MGELKTKLHTVQEKYLEQRRNGPSSSMSKFDSIITKKKQKEIIAEQNRMQKIQETQKSQKKVIGEIKRDLIYVRKEWDKITKLQKEIGNWQKSLRNHVLQSKSREKKAEKKMELLEKKLEQQEKKLQLQENKMRQRDL